MKKFAIGVSAFLLVGIVFVPVSQAQAQGQAIPAGKVTNPSCIYLDNFCDRIQINVYEVHGLAEHEVVGLWDWECGGPLTLISGHWDGKAFMGTQPVDPNANPVASGFNAHFTFAEGKGDKKKPVPPLFDLYGTDDGMTTFPYQLAQPWHLVPGACPAFGPLNAGKPPSVPRR